MNAVRKPRECDRVRPAHDAGDVARLRKDPADANGKLDVELDGSFPASDPPSQTQPEPERGKPI